jgi:outer membrane scaffolding protein for murein synthesis (MipA/OmpV family)
MHLRQLIALTILALAAGVALAQESSDGTAVAAASGVPSAGGPARAGWRTEFGIGAIVNPKFVGSDKYNTRAIPYLDLRYLDEKGTRFFANVPQGIGGFFYRSANPRAGNFLNIGAAVAPGFNVRDDSIEGLDEVGVSTEARIYLQTGGRSWAATATLAQDVGSGHEGAYLDLGVNYRGRIGPRSGFYALGPVLRYGDSTYTDSFFGVSPEDSAETGLPRYDADAGFERLGFQGLISVPLSRSKWRFTALARASRLSEDAADSPIVVDETQLFFLTAVTRSF